MDLRVLTAADLRRALPMDAAIEAMKLAYGQLSSGEAVAPARTRIDTGGGSALFMPALLSGTGDLALKVVSVFPENVRRELPTIHALVVALDPETGRPLALIEGGALTAIRTGAGSGAATDLLALPDASSVAMLGSGVQARTQFEAMCSVRRIHKAWVFSPNHEHAEAFASEAAALSEGPGTISVVAGPSEAVREADIIVAATTSHQPVFDGRLPHAGVHVNAVGSFTPEMQEIDGDLVSRAAVFVDSRQAALAEAGDLLVPIEAGELSRDHILAEIGEVINGTHPGRTNPEQLTLFKSVGVAAQDAAAAGVALRRAEELELGRIIEL